MRIKQLLFFITTLGCMVEAHAIGAGMYAGIALGPATNNASPQQAQVSGLATTPPTTTLVNPKSQQFGSRIFIGYMPVPFAGFEGGATFFSNIQYEPTRNNKVCGSADARVRDFEILGKGAYNFKGQFSPVSVFGKLGVAFTYQTEGGALNPSTTQECGKTTYLTKAAPAYSAGFGYDMTQNWQSELGVHVVDTGGKVGRMTMYAFSLSYHFADTYCGQFLC